MPHRRHLALAALALILVETPPSSEGAVEPSAEYRAVLRRTLELRKARRSARTAEPIGQIVPFPLPPTLIIRHTREVHGEIEDLLRLLRR